MAAYSFFPLEEPGLRVGHFLMRYADGQTRLRQSTNMQY
jgi:hypothetical protein